MNVTQGNMFWNEQVGIIQKYPYLSKDKKCDVLVIGAGIGGALTAYMQAKQGANIIVVDKNIIGYGATMQTDGTIETRVDFNNKIQKNASEKNINKCNNLCKQALEDIKGIINELAEDEDCKKYIARLGFRNVDLMYYSDKITNKIVMYKNFEKLGRENSDIEYLEQDPLINLRTAIIFPNSAAIMNPYVLTQLIFIHLNKMENVEIYENTNITNITCKDEVVESITDNRFKIFSKSIILTNGIHTLEHLKEDNITLNKTFTLITEKINSLDGNIINVVAKDINFPNTTIAFTQDKRIVVCGEDIKQNERMVNDQYLIRFADGKYKKMYLTFKRLLNIPDDVKVTNCFSGMYLDTKDGLPIIDELENMPNVYCNLSTGKNGIIFSMIGARMLRNVSKQYHEKDMYMFRENR
ncbi:MAG: FAD-binding oxidoreductase [Clostridia bacterium]|nr:FAD-binding oxidoreductase [Clostridia bacterium]